MGLARVQLFRTHCGQSGGWRAPRTALSTERDVAQGPSWLSSTAFSNTAVLLRRHTKLCFQLISVCAIIQLETTTSVSIIPGEVRTRALSSALPPIDRHVLPGCPNTRWLHSSTFVGCPLCKYRKRIVCSIASSASGWHWPEFAGGRNSRLGCVLPSKPRPWAV